MQRGNVSRDCMASGKCLGFVLTELVLVVILSHFCSSLVDQCEYYLFFMNIIWFSLILDLLKLTCRITHCCLLVFIIIIIFFILLCCSAFFSFCSLGQVFLVHQLIIPTIFLRSPMAVLLVELEGAYDALVPGSLFVSCYFC